MTTLDHIHDAPDPSSVSPWPTAIRYGLIAGLISIIYATIGFITGITLPSAGFLMIGINTIISFGIFIGVIVFAVRKHRNEELGGFISFGRIVLIGVIITVISGLLGTFYQHIYTNYVDPSYMAKVMEETVAMMEKFNVPEENVEETIAQMEAGNTFGSILKGFGIIAIFGAIISSIIGAVMKRNPPEYA